MSNNGNGLDVEIGVTLGRLTRQLGQAEARFTRTTVQMEAKFRQANMKVAKSFEQVDRTSSNVFRNMLRGASIVTGALGVREVQRYADAWTQIENEISAAEQISGTAARTTSELNELAAEGRSGLSETANLYARLLRVSGDLNVSEQDVARATLITTKAFKAGGAAASEQAAGVLQLSQALSSGVLQGDELRSLRENAPLITQAIADEFDTTIGGLKALGAAGELTSERVFQALLNGQANIEAAFAKTRATIGDSFTLFRNALTEYIADADKTFDVTGKLAVAMQVLGENLDLVAAGAVILATAGITPLAISMAAKLAPAAATAGAALQLLTVRGGATYVAMNALKASMAILGGPLGIAVLGASAAAYAFMNMKTSAEQLSEATSGLQSDFADVERVSSDLEDDYRALEQANKDLAEAQRDGGQAAVDAATLEIDAVNVRIAKSKELRQEMAILQQQRVNEAQAAFDLAQAEFNSESDAKALMVRMRIAAESEKLAEEGLRLTYEQVIAIGDEVQALKLNEDQIKATQQSYRDLLQQKVANGQELTKQEQSWLEMAIALQNALIELEATKQALQNIGQAGPVAAAGMNTAAIAAANLANQAAIAANGISTLISLIPELNAAAQTADKIAVATEAYNQALSGAVRPDQIAEASRLFELAKAEINGTAQATRDATTALDNYLERSHLGSLDAQSRAIENEKIEYAELVQEITAAAEATGNLTEANIDLAAAKSAHDQNLMNIENAYAGGGGGGGGGGGEGTGVNVNNTEIESLRFQIELIGKTTAEVAGLTYKYQALQKAKQDGVALDKIMISTGITLAEQIDLEAAAITKLTLKAEQYAEQTAFAVDMTQQFKDGLIDAIIEGGNLGDVLKDMAKQFAKAALQAALFGEGPLAALFGTSPGAGGGSLLGGLFSGLLGLSGGGYTGDGGKHEPKGIVHGGEYVFSKEATSKIGVRSLDRMHSKLKGYASGGYVGSMPAGSAATPDHSIVHRTGGDTARVALTVFVEDDGTLGAIARQEGAAAALPVAVAVVKESGRQAHEARRRS